MQAAGATVVAAAAQIVFATRQTMMPSAEGAK